MTDEKAVHHQTKRAADLALAKRLISRDSHNPILRGELSLPEANSLGRDRRPDTSEDQSGPGETTKRSRRGRQPRPCICCGGLTKGGRFHPGCDQRLYGRIQRQLRVDPLLRSNQFTDEQRRYAVERRLAGPEVLPKDEGHDG